MQASCSDRSFTSSWPFSKPREPRRYPSFGRQIEAILADPKQLETYAGCSPCRATIWVANGAGAWDWKNSHPSKLTICLPFGDNPANYYWGFLAGHEPVLILPPAADCPHQRDSIIAAMARDGVLKVLALGGIGDSDSGYGFHLFTLGDAP